ncbi:MAG: NADP-dependent oxidoreductase [Deltaproteobacteria bacterium]|nr:NADP-dependent oxidoreductase [Deltaproteobacteria bacterium]
MKSVRIHTYGGPEVLVYEDAPRPTPGTGEVLIRVHAAGVNPVDWKVREGYVKQWITHSLPLIPGWDVSGVVEAAGPGARRLQKGDEVYSRPDISRDGAYAQYIVVRESEVAIKPESLDHIHAAAIPLAALTAWQALFDAAGLGAGQKVLIHAAGGGVGSFAVQLAKWKGAHVIGTASKRNHDFLRTLGADETIDYTATRFEDAVRNVDVVLDTMGGDTQKRSWKVLRKGGILVSILTAPPPEEAAAHGMRQAYTFVQPNAAQLVEIAKLADSGKLRPVVETVLPLPEARRAQELSQAGHVRGKIVLRVA